MSRTPALAFAATLALTLSAACSKDAGTGGPTGSTGSGGGAGGNGGAGSSGSMGTGGSGGAPLTCGNNGWVTYGHDGARTSASDGCMNGPLELLWSYTPSAPAGKMVERLWSTVATTDAVFLHWSATIPPYIGTTAADRIGLDGKSVWTFDSGSDANLGDWGSLWNGRFVLNADGIYELDEMTGKSAAGTGVDWWGQSIPDSGALYVSNTSKSDGPGLFVAALDDKAQVIWKQNEQGTQCGQALTDQTGGIALDGTTLFYAPRYATGSATKPTFASGIYAFDTANAGKQRWTVATTPAGVISAGGGNIYLVEAAMPGMAQLVARRQTDGSVAWSAKVTPVGDAPAPVLASGLVILQTNEGVVAWSAADGKPAWTAAMLQGGFPPNTISVSNGCAGLQPLSNVPNTSIAAALGSGTLVVLQGMAVHVLSLKTGMELWQGSPMGVMGQLMSPVIVGHRLYVVEPTAMGGRLLALQGM